MDPTTCPRCHHVAGGRRWRLTLAVALSLVVPLVLCGPRPALAQLDEDPALDQTIDADAPVVTGETTIDAGHVDIGPRFVDGQWAFLVHDDTEIPSVWRSFDETVLQVADTGLLPIPDDPTYGFLGADPGDEVHVVPQTEGPEVVWLGWNTQDPEVMEVIDRGATLTLLGVEGPGELTMYLQSGDLSEPQVLWQSTVPEPQPLWVEVNTHAHANWVFTEPGVYLVQVEVSADLLDGDEVTDTRTLRFAVGDATDPDDALAAEYTAAPPADADTEATGSPATTADEGGADDGAATGVVIAAAIATLALVVGLVIVLTRQSSAQRRAELERAGASPADATDTGPRP